MRMIVGFQLIVSILLFAGCSVDTSTAVRLDAFDPDGHSSAAVTQDQVQEIAKHGMIVSFEEGDEIVLELGLVESDLVEKVDAYTLRVKRPFHLYASSEGIRVSLDGEDFQRKVTHGQIGVGFQMSSKEKQNKVAIALNERLTER